MLAFVDPTHGNLVQFALLDLVLCGLRDGLYEPCEGLCGLCSVGELCGLSSSARARALSPESSDNRCGNDLRVMLFVGESGSPFAFLEYGT